MRRFLYLNNDSIYSYISQMNDGLPTKVTNANSSSKESEKETKANIDGKLDVDLKILGKGLGADLSADIGDVVSKITTNQQSNSMEKKIYDEAFDKFKQHLIDNKLLKETNINIGDFFEIYDEMFIVDLEYVGVKKIINAVLNIVPYNKFGIMGDYLIVLDDEYFRDKTKVVAYKYGGKMSMLGYLTNIVNNDVTQDDSNVFRTFPALINTFMLGFFNKNEIKIIHPVAIYY